MDWVEKDLRSPHHLEFRLDWLIERSEIRQPRADRRLNGVENTLRQLARRWRPELPIDPAAELSMDGSTASQLVRWIVAEQLPTGTAIQRLGVYVSGSVLAADVRPGWIRINLPTPICALKYL